MGPPWLIAPGYNLVSTWAHFSLSARPLCRQALIVATIFHTSLYLHLAVLCHTDVRLGYVTCFGQGLITYLMQREALLGTATVKRTSLLKGNEIPGEEPGYLS